MHACMPPPTCASAGPLHTAQRSAHPQPGRKQQQCTMPVRTQVVGCSACRPVHSLLLLLRLRLIYMCSYICAHIYVLMHEHNRLCTAVHDPVQHIGRFKQSHHDHTPSPSSTSGTLGCGSLTAHDSCCHDASTSSLCVRRRQAGGKGRHRACALERWLKLPADGGCCKASLTWPASVHAGEGILTAHPGPCGPR